MTPLVFISYSDKDKRRAGAYKDELESNHYLCFLAHEDIEATEDWHEEIWNNLRKAEAFIGLVTKHSNCSAFCQQEIGAALAWKKPSLLVFCDTHRRVPGFAARFQAVKPAKLLSSLNGLPSFRRLRVEAWIHATRGVGSFKEANVIYQRFRHEWSTMTDDEKLRWILASANNRQVYDEGYIVGPFYHKKLSEMKPLLTKQWLFENDKNGVLHDIDSNPVGKHKA